MTGTWASTSWKVKYQLHSKIFLHYNICKESYFSFSVSYYYAINEANSYWNERVIHSKMTEEVSFAFNHLTVAGWYWKNNNQSRSLWIHISEIPLSIYFSTWIQVLETMLSMSQYSNRSANRNENLFRNWITIWWIL